MSSKPTNLHALTIHEAADLLRRREISAVELTQAVFEQIDRREPVVHAYITLCREQALADAAAVDKRRVAGEELSPLAGIPLGIKDNLCTLGVRTTCASRILDDFKPPYDATVIARLKAAGAVMVGKSNMDEFAMGSSTEYSAFGPTTNPWDPTKVPGGSSGGSAAAVAAGEALGALGSDTGGSVRLPASFCGVVGLKPTYGRVSRYGLVAFGSSLDQVGPLTRDVTDAAMLLNAIAGHDPNDSTTLPWPVPDYTKSLIADVRGLRIGVPKEYFVEGMHPGVTEVVRRAIERLEQLGAQVGETSLPNTRYALAAYYIVAPAEASANLARYDGVKYGISIRDHANGQGGLDIWESFERTREAGFGPEIKRRIMLGTYALSSGYYEAYYLRAMKVRTLIKQDFDRAFGEFDVLAVPTAPTVPFTIGERVDNPVQMYLTDVCTITVNAAGIPALSVPCGLVGGLPVGLQLLGRAGDEERLFRVGYTFEQHTEPLPLPF